jgi:AraC family L-rhamnose operon regulatory protein RhaS
MAAHVGLKRTQFSELIHHHTGDSPMLHLNRLRVAKARKLLASTRRSVTEIAYECGFTSSQYFADVFHTLTGKTASSFRKNPPQFVSTT